MNKNKKGFAGVALLILLAAGLIGAGIYEGLKKSQPVPTPNITVGATGVVQAQAFYLSGSGATASQNTISLTSFKLSDASTTIVMADFTNGIGYGTIEPGSSKEEQISFTGITQNVDGSATLTGVTRGLNFVLPCTAVTAYQKAHAGGTKFVLSNTACFYSQFPSTGSTSTINAVWTFATSGIPVLSTTATSSFVTPDQFITKGYADSLSFSGAPNGSLTQKGIYQEATKAQTVAGTAVGSTGADLVVPNSYFSNTPSATATVPVTDSDGTLPTGFVKQTASSSYNFLGNMNFASTTNSGTSTIQNAKINNNLVVSGNATLSGVNSGNFPNLISASTTNVTNNGTNETNIFSVSIPGGTLLTGNVIKAETTLEYVTRFTSVSNFILRLKYGSTNIATSTISLTSSSQKPSGKLSVELFSAGTTSSQEANMFYLFPEATPTSTITWNSRLVGTSAEDSTTAKNLTLSMEVSGANDVVTAYNWYVAKLIQ